MRVADWNALDWVLVAVVLVSVAAGVRRGLVRTLLGLLGYIAGFTLASWKYVQMADQIVSHEWIRSQATARVVAYLLIVAVVVIVVELIAKIAHKTVHAVGLSFMNRLLGAGFGLLRGGIAGMALLMIPATFGPGSRLLQGSVLTPCFLAVAHDVSFLVPRYLQRLTLRTDLTHKKNNRTG